MPSRDAQHGALRGACPYRTGKCHRAGQQEAGFAREYFFGGDLKPTCWGWVKASCWEAAHPAPLRFGDTNRSVQGIRAGIP